MRNLAIVFGLFAAFALNTGAAAQSYPSKMVKILVNSAPGGPVDITARAIREHLQAAWGQPVIVENKVAAIGVAGALEAAQSPPDGHTILVSGAGPMLISPLTRTSMPYDVAKDFEPVTLCTEVPVFIGANPSAAATLEELVARAKREPGKISYASTGVGGPNNMLFEYLKLLAEIDLLHVPYKGSAQAVLALLAREIDLFAMLPGDALAHAKDGKIRLLAYSGATRSPQAPDVPTFAEAGYPNLGMPSFFASFVPAGTPRDVIAKIDAATQAALASPSVGETLKTAGFEIRALGPDKFKEYMVREREKWGAVVKQAGIKVE